MNSLWLRYLPEVVRTRLAGRYGLQKALGNTGWLFADKVLRMGVGLVVSVWLARYLGPEQFGTLSYALAFVALFLPFATLGLDSIVVRELVNQPEDSGEILGTAFLLKALAGVGAVSAAYLAISFLRPGDDLIRWLVLIVSVGGVAQAFDTIDFWFQARVEARYSVYARNGAFLLASAARVVLILAAAPLVAFAWAVFAEAALGALGLVLVYRLRGYLMSAWSRSGRRARGLLQQSWPMALAGIAVVIYMRIDQIMLGELLSQQAVGIYTAAVRISEVWYFIPVAIVSSVTPALYEAKKTSEQLYQDRLAQLFRLMLWLAIAVALPLTFAANLVIDLLYGDSYQGAGGVLALHVWAGVFVFLGVAQNPWSVNEGLTRLALARTAAGAAVNVLLNLVLIPRYGVMGAAAATIISYSLSAVLLNALSARTRPIFFLQLSAILPGRSGRR